MSYPGPSCVVSLALVVPAALSGCAILHPHRPVTVLMRDAETRQPIPGAEVCIAYTPDSSAQESFGTADNAGVARVRAERIKDLPIAVNATAKGYLTEKTYIPLETVRTIAPGHGSKDGDRPVSIVVDMLAEPRPSVELVVPAGYRGVIKAEVDVQDGVPSPPGQRLFRFDVTAEGVVRVAGPSLLRRAAAPDFQVRYADGVTLSWHADASELGFWWLHHDGRYDYYLVGNRHDYDEWRRSDEGRAAQAPPTSSGGREAGSGRGHRRSN